MIEDKFDQVSQALPAQRPAALTLAHLSPAKQHTDENTTALLQLPGSPGEHACSV